MRATPAGKRSHRYIAAPFGAKAAAKETADAATPTQRKRTRAESLINSIGVLAAKIGGLELSDFSAEDRAGIIDAMTSMKGAPWKQQFPQH